MDPTAIEVILGNVGDVFTMALTMVGTVADTVSAEPLLLIFVILPLVGLGVGLFKRLLNL